MVENIISAHINTFNSIKSVFCLPLICATQIFCPRHRWRCPAFFSFNVLYVCLTKKIHEDLTDNKLDDWSSLCMNNVGKKYKMILLTDFLEILDWCRHEVRYQIVRNYITYILQYILSFHVK